MKTQKTQLPQTPPGPINISKRTSEPKKPGSQIHGSDRQYTQISGLSPLDIPLTPENNLFLQRMMGNRAFGQIVQAKLEIGRPNDKYEQEADRVAEQVMRMPEPTLQRNPT